MKDVRTIEDDDTPRASTASASDAAVLAGSWSSEADAAVIANPWGTLRQFTAARIAQGRAGVSMPTEPQLQFQLAHARARDAVHVPLDMDRLLKDLASAGVAPPAAVLQLESAAADRACYLQRPDLGRRLSPAARDRLITAAADRPPDASAHDIALVLADGLSPLAINRQAPPFLAALRGALAREGWRVAPLTIVQQARVAIGDEIGALLGARMVVVLIGERPGLSAPDSMGLYMTWMPRIGLADDSRNCISNVRQAGLPPVDAAAFLHQLLAQAFRRQLSGVQLKDISRAPAEVRGNSLQFLLVVPALAAPPTPDAPAI